MAKTTRRNADNLVTVPVDVRETETSAESLDGAIARRAFELYCARGCEHGHDVEDWLDAEREVRRDTTSTAA